MQYFEDVVIGRSERLGTHTFTAEEIKRFAARYDPQRFHLDETAAAQTHFGALCASGWHTVGVWMRLFVASRKQIAAERRAVGEPVAVWGPSPGFRDLRWLKPVYVGDTITFATEPIEKRPSESRPGWGLVFSRNTGTDATGQLVLAFTGSIFIERRPA